ncbi:uncharacterized protein LOC118279801 [Spodoptera frugiperda]|uniref:Uncharacterized protein LOC118279801 n=1 Tax=Spodoptera frugiperda TaxID=7108 RepID=A0A9R0E442_SPOFR|nr:uncharacterized protein LOC118279801 [Spodoptera frugiperda]
MMLCNLRKYILYYRLILIDINITNNIRKIINFLTFLDAKSNQDNAQPITKTKIIPTFGKQKNLKKNDKKSLSKPKKFVPPIKCTTNSENNISTTNIGPKHDSNQHLQPTSISNQDLITNVCDTSLTEISHNNNDIYTFPDLLTLENTPNITNIEYTESNYNNIGHSQVVNESLHVNNAIDSQEKTKITNKGVFLPKRMLSNKLGSIISSSINILEDENTILEENFETFTQISNSDRCSVKSLSQNQNLSFCSVTSLSKTYKNLDCNSFKTETHRIPQGDEFFNLFKSNIVCSDDKKPVPMTTEYGDIGFNLKYSDYIKNVGEMFERTDEEMDVILKIVNMYPKENSLMKKKLAK